MDLGRHRAACGRRRGWARPSPLAPVSYQIAHPRFATIRKTLTLPGTVEPTGEAEVSFAAPGVVATVDVNPGSRVQKGQVLATLNTTPIRLALSAAAEGGAKRYARRGNAALAGY